MLLADSDALECDLAETYGIYEMRDLKPTKIAVFACGLRDNARIIKKMAGRETDFNRVLQAGIFDILHMILWTKSKEGTDKPKMLMDLLLNANKEAPEERFERPEDFEKRWKELGGM